MDFGLSAAHAEGLTEMSRSSRPKGRSNRVSVAFSSSSFTFNDLPVPRTLANWHTRCTTASRMGFEE